MKVARIFLESNDDGIVMTSSYADPRGGVWWWGDNDWDRSVRNVDVYKRQVWCSEFDGGRIWYTAAGHRPSDYADTLYREQVLGGLRWIMAGQARDTETAE